VRRTALLLLPFAAACQDEPDRGYAATAGGAREEAYVAIPPGSVPVGEGERISASTPPGPPVTPSLIRAGAEAYQGYCAPCHGRRGAGDGPVTQKGFPAPPPLASRPHSPADIVDIIGQGRGKMPPLAEEMPPLKRWAVAHYLARGAAGGQ
jgi:mono/diheme cytochrome c family protein